MSRRSLNRRYAVLAAIRANPRASIRELMEVTGLSSTSVVVYQMKKLEEEGFIQRERYMARSIYLTGRSHSKSCPKDSRENYVKKAAAGRKGRGKNAFQAKKSSTLEERIDRIVRRASEASNNAGSSVDVIRVNTSIWRVKGARVG